MGLPGFFIALSGATLVLALAALFRSLRAAFGDDDEGESAMAVDGAERGSLLEEKKSLLRALKDLEYEHAVGKIDDADFERLNHAYRARARQVLARLDDDLGAHRAAAASLIEAYVSGAADEGEAPTKKKKKKKGKDTKPKASAQPKSEAKDEPQAKGDAEHAEPPDAEQSEGEPDADADALVCPKCETKNDVDATFCKRCAARLSSASDSSASDSSASDSSASESSASESSASESSASDSSEGPSSDSSAEGAAEDAS